MPDIANLTYATVGGRDLRLDLYLPDPNPPGPDPLVIWIHGGGWSMGTKSNPTGREALNAAGVAVASIEYRLTSQEDLFGGEPVTWPAQMHDVKAAVRFLRANAEQWGIEPSRIGVFGASAGGHLAAVLAMSGGDPFLEGEVGDHLDTSSRVQAAAEYFGPTALLLMQPDVTDPPGTIINHDAPSSGESRLIGWDQPGQGIGDIRANLNNPNPPYDVLVPLTQSSSPMAYVGVGDPPIFIAHGDQDVVVPLNQSQRLANRCSQVGVEHEFHIVEGAGHGDLGQPTLIAAVEFLTGKLTRTCSGDVNNDGRLNGADFNAWLNAFNNGSPRADQNGDGMLDGSDFNAWLANFNAGCE